MSNLAPELTWQVRAARAALEAELRKRKLWHEDINRHFEEVCRYVIEQDSGLNRLFFVEPTRAVETIFARLFVPIAPPTPAK